MASQMNSQPVQTRVKNLWRFFKSPESSQSRRTLLELLDRLLLEMNALRSEAVEYMSVVTERFPSWSRRVERLRWEGVGCFQALRDLRQRISRISPFRFHRQVRHDVREWMKSFRTHRRRENRLLQTAMLLDIGGES